jgi:hypothetical protein
MPTITIHNVETNEVIEREMNAEETAQWEADKAASELETQAATAAAIAKAALLEKLGITEDEAKLLLA